MKQLPLQIASAVFALHFLVPPFALAQDASPAEIERGSTTARNGFRNEEDIRDRFNNWQHDLVAQSWLAAMNYDLKSIRTLTATKPHGHKADVEVSVDTQDGHRIERISIKLVSSANGFNQIYKRWLSTYAAMWDMPADVVESLKLFVGETPPFDGSRTTDRMYLNELNPASQRAVIEFFTQHKDRIVSDLLSGDGEHAANWFMVTCKATDPPKWLIRSSEDAVRFFGQGEVQLTRAGNLKIGRIGMQRKGGDNGRETAKMLQFKINPVQLFDMPALDAAVDKANATTTDHTVPHRLHNN